MITLVAIYKNVPFQVNPAVNIFGQPLENLGYFSFQHLVTLVNILALHSDDLSSNPVYIFS